jgi:isopentenyl diphosphate isomerase/L-lactate dehydrogenase-like FMN-dependent dehydrogenase
VEEKALRDLVAERLGQSWKTHAGHFSQALKEQEGVERVLEILHSERSLTMRQCGIPSVAQITRASVLRNDVKL